MKAIKYIVTIEGFFKDNTVNWIDEEFKHLDIFYIIYILSKCLNIKLYRISLKAN